MKDKTFFPFLVNKFCFLQHIHSKIKQKVQRVPVLILPAPYTHTISPTVDILYHSGTFVTISEPTMMHSLSPEVCSLHQDLLLLLCIPLVLINVQLHVLTPGLGRSPGGGHNNPLQYSCLENTMDRGAWQATVHSITVRHNSPQGHSQTQLSNLAHTTHHCSVIHFHNPKTLCTLPVHSSLPTNPWSFYCLHSFAFSRRSYFWNHAVCNVFKLSSFTQ